MTAYLSIDGVVSDELLFDANAGADGLTFDLIMNWSDVVARLARAHDDGEVFSRGMLTTDVQTWALYGLRVTSVAIGNPPTTSAVQLQAETAQAS